MLAAVAVHLGAGPFVEGLRLTSGWALLAATLVTAVTTACCAWRWRLVAAGLGAPLAPGTAVAGVYRAQFLNATLPGGILGDVDRAVGHGRGQGIVGPGVRAVVWERTLGQAVQVLLTAAVLLVLPSAMRPVGFAAAATLGVALLAGLLAGRARPSATGLLAALGADLRGILGTRRARAGIALASAAAVAGHLLLFLVAARVAGVSAPVTQLVPLAAVVLLASAVPANVAGWGPREGVAAWAFAAAGLGASAGLTTAVVYGVMVLAATLPGAAVLLRGRGAWPRTVVPTSAPVLEEATSG